MPRDFQIDIIVGVPGNASIYTVDAVWMSPEIDPDGITLLWRWVGTGEALAATAEGFHHLRGVRPMMKEIGPRHYVLLGPAKSHEWLESQNL